MQYLYVSFQAVRSRLRQDVAIGSAAFNFLAALAAVSLGACSSLPSDGPSAGDIREESSQVGDAFPFQLVTISGPTIAVMSNRRDDSLAARFGDYRPAPELTIGPGDGITVNLWETGSDTLFAPTVSPTSAGPALVGGRGTLIPEQIVGSDGGISVPFAGRITVVGRTTLDVQKEIEKALAGIAQKPQIVVNITRPTSSTVTVIGEASGGGRATLSVGGQRLLDVLAAVGGLRAASYETRLELTRDGTRASVPLTRVLNDPKENIFLRPGDDLAVLRQPQSFTVFGATGRSAQINLDAARLNLIEAVAKSGGLLDSRADPHGIFLFRYEPEEIASELAPNARQTGSDELVPVIYQLDLTKAGNFFLAQSFEIRDRDVLYVASSRVNQLGKFLQLIGLFTQPIINGAVAAQAVNR